jgi:SAM-dependent methyltransferase
VESEGAMSLTDVPSSDFSSLYLSDHERSKTRRRTIEWTIPVLKGRGLEGGKILSAGCGNGMDVVELRERGFQSVGFDLYPPAAPAAPWVAIARAHSIPFETGSFDAALCLEVIEHIPRAERSAVSNELLRVIRPGGFIIIATPNRYFPADEHASWLRIHSPFRDDTLSAKELEELFGRKGRTLTWKRYFQFERFGVLGAGINQAVTLFDNSLLHRSALNPHLFLAFQK